MGKNPLFFVFRGENKINSDYDGAKVKTPNGLQNKPPKRRAI